jgi:hypothetical protein
MCRIGCPEKLRSVVAARMRRAHHADSAAAEAELNAFGRRAGQDPPRGGGQPREFAIRTSIGRLRVAECGLCGTLTIQDGGQLRHIALHEATGTLGPDLARGGST